jgi:hypothetical protein
MKHPQNGPTFTKGQPKKSKPMEHDRKAGADAQAALDAAKVREFHTDSRAFLKKYMLKKELRGRLT